MDRITLAGEYASHLTGTDLELIASVQRDAAGRAGDAAARAAVLRRDPDALLAALEDPRLLRAVLPTGGEASPAPAPASPFLVFVVAVHRTAAELASAGFVPERTGPRQQVPLFDAPALRDFLSAPARRLFLAELLASFTRIASGRYQVLVRGQARTRRFSELDPVRLAGLLDAVPEAERPGVYRRLGDVALFLTGIFPDYAAGPMLGLASAPRLLRVARVPGPDRERLATAPPLDLLEYLGARWYRAAWDLAPAGTARLAVVAEVAERFRQARRVLNQVADRYLFPARHQWFGQPG